MSLSKDPPVSHIDSQDQFPDLISSQHVQSTVLSSMINPAVPISADERDQLLEDALAKSRTNRLARAYIQGDGSQSPTPAASKPHEEAATASMEHLQQHVPAIPGLYIPASTGTWRYAPTTNSKSIAHAHCTRQWTSASNTNGPDTVES